MKNIVWHILYTGVYCISLCIVMTTLHVFSIIFIFYNSQLLNLQKTFNDDSRFKLTERFLESDSENEGESVIKKNKGKLKINTSLYWAPFIGKSWGATSFLFIFLEALRPSTPAGNSPVFKNIQLFSAPGNTNTSKYSTCYSVFFTHFSKTWNEINFISYLTFSSFSCFVYLGQICDIGYIVWSLICTSSGKNCEGKG